MHVALSATLLEYHPLAQDVHRQSLTFHSNVTVSPGLTWMSIVSVEGLIAAKTPGEAGAPGFKSTIVGSSL
jgi:hypothetical protein